MKPIQMYQSESGRRFLTAAEAERDETIWVLQCEANKLLPSAVDDGCAFANGGGYIQHSKASIQSFTDATRKAIALEFGESSDTLKAWDKCPAGFVGRYLDDSGSRSYELWGRLAKIDKSDREWGQAYYALNPGKGTMKLWPALERRGLRLRKASHE